MSFKDEMSKIVQNRHNHHRLNIHYNAALENLNIQHNRAIRNRYAPFFLGHPVIQCHKAGLAAGVSRAGRRCSPSSGGGCLETPLCSPLYTALCKMYFISLSSAPKLSRFTLHCTVLYTTFHSILRSAKHSGLVRGC